jgi:hypothetical protein
VGNGRSVVEKRVWFRIYRAIFTIVMPGYFGGTAFTRALE